MSGLVFRHIYSFRLAARIAWPPAEKHYEGDGDVIFKHACSFSCEGRRVKTARLSVPALAALDQAEKSQSSCVTREVVQIRATDGLRSQRGFAWSNDDGGEINWSASARRDAVGCDSGAVHPAKLATTRAPIQTIFTNSFLTVQPA